MKALLDGRELKLESPTVASGLSAALRQAEVEGRIIIEAWADGRPLTENELTAPSNTPGEVLCLELTSAEPRELVRTTLLDAADALNQAKADQAEAARLIQSGHTDRLVEPIRSVVETWSQVRSIIERGSGILGVDLGTLARSSGGLGAPIAELSIRLGTLKDAMGREDWSLLSDVIGYELGELADTWRVRLIEIADVLESGGGGAKR